MPTAAGTQENNLNDDMPDDAADTSGLHDDKTESRDAGTILPNKLGALEKFCFKRSRVSRW
jgi:hypothetical protein